MMYEFGFVTLLVLSSTPALAKDFDCHNINAVRPSPTINLGADSPSAGDPAVAVINCNPHLEDPIPAGDGTTCTEGDWKPGLCDLPPVPGTRCANAEFFKFYCAKTTAGCENVPGGCFGGTPPGHWFSMPEKVGGDGIPHYRCKCGCFAEETTFEGLLLPSGRELIDRKNEESLSVGSLDALDGVTLSERAINGIMHSPESEGSITLETAGGRSITLSQAHPVAIGDENGKLLAMKQAREVKAGDLVIDREGHADPVLRISEKAYGGEMVNFNVKSQSPAHHIVVANGLKMGDHAWQERLSSIESRLLYRADIVRALEGRR